MGEKSFSHFYYQYSRSPAGEEHGIAAISGGHNAIEHINAHGNAFQDIPGRAHAHEVAGLSAGRWSQQSEQISYILSIGSPTLQSAYGISHSPFELMYSGKIF